MKPYDGDGRELDAIFSVHRNSGDELYLIIESRGGGRDGPRPPRNADYAPVMELLLRRLGANKARLNGVEVFSGVTEKWPAEQRQITAPSFPLPLELSKLDDVQGFRNELARASAALGREAGKTGGNPTKRLRLSLSWPGSADLSKSQLEDVLASASREPSDDAASGSTMYAPLGAFLKQQRGDEVRLRLSSISALLGKSLPQAAWTPQFWANTTHHQSRRRQWLDAGFEAFFEKRSETVRFRRTAPPAREETFVPEKPTADPEALRSRARSAKRKMTQAGLTQMAGPPQPTTPRATGSVERFVRDPNVIAAALIAANGHCDVCGQPAPFVDADDEPFLEVHHVRPLGQGGPDHITNAIAACPNCHRRLHYGRDRHLVRLDVISRIPRLVDYPVVLIAAIGAVENPTIAASPERGARTGAPEEAAP